MNNKYGSDKDFIWWYQCAQCKQQLLIANEAYFYWYSFFLNVNHYSLKQQDSSWSQQHNSVNLWKIILPVYIPYSPQMMSTLLPKLTAQLSL